MGIIGNGSSRSRSQHEWGHSTAVVYFVPDAVVDSKDRSNIKIKT